MPRFSLSRFRGKFAKESRQLRQRQRLEKALSKEQKRYERYAAQSEGDKELMRLKQQIAEYKQIRGAKSRRVKIGGHTFRI